MIEALGFAAEVVTFFVAVSVGLSVAMFVVSIAIIGVTQMFKRFGR